MYYIVLFCTVPSLFCTVLHFTVLYCTVLYCTAGVSWNNMYTTWHLLWFINGVLSSSNPPATGAGVRYTNIFRRRIMDRYFIQGVLINMGIK